MKPGARLVCTRRGIRLRGCENDVSVAFVRRFGTTWGCPTRTSPRWLGGPASAAQRPTRENILRQLGRLADIVQPGDRVVFHFSGHGSNQPDAPSNRDELDGRDEILLPADVRKYRLRTGSVPGCITDDELWEHVRAIRDAGATVWLSLDCCHSGGATRGDGSQTRDVDPSVLGVPEEPGVPKSAPPLPAADDLSGVVTLTAAHSDQRAVERVLPRNRRARGRRRHGLYTFLLARTLQRYGGDLTFGEVHAHLLAGYADQGRDDVAPTVEGRSDLRVWRSPARTPPLQLYAGDNGLVLKAGVLRGVCAGTVLEVYRPGKSGDDDHSLGLVRVVAPGLAESTCVPHDPDPFRAAQAPARPLPAVLRVRAVGEVSLGLAVLNDDGTVLLPTDYPEAVRSVLDDPLMQARFPISESQHADWVLRVAADAYTLVPAGASHHAPRFRVAQEELERRLYAVYRAHGLRRLASSDTLAPLPERLKVDMYFAPTEEDYRAGRRSLVQPGMRLTPGCYFGLEIVNLTRRFIDVTVLQLDANLGIGVAFPNRTYTSCRIDRKDTRTIPLGPWLQLDESLGAESMIVLAVPAAQDTPIADFRFLRQASLAPVRGASSEATRFLHGLLSGGGQTRAAPPPAESLTMKVMPWRTAWGPLAIPKDVRDQGTPTPQAERVPLRADSPWYLGRRIKVLPGDDRMATAIVTWDEDVAQIYIDGDGREAPPDGADAARQIGQRVLGADLVVRVKRSRHTAWYARAGDLALRRTDGRGDESWLRVADLPQLRKSDRDRVLRRLASFVVDRPSSRAR